MLIQYLYAVLTMLPCPIWFYSRWASALFLMAVFAWSVYNGSTYYIDVFGKRFQKELEAMKADENRVYAGTFSKSIRQQAATALGKIGATAAEVVEALIVALGDREVGMRLAAAQALGMLGSGAKSAIPTLLVLLEDKNEHLQREVARALQSIDATAAPGADKQ